MILIASCTEDTAEVDDLVRGEEYVTVRMQVPGMKTAATRADEAEDNLTSVWALVFRDGKLVSKTEVSTLIPSTSTIGTFNLSRPKVDDVIHFLGNVPSDVTLPDVGDDESALCDLETGDPENLPYWENLSYWGKATYTGTDIDVTLYRNLAKIEIVAGDECTFPEDQLFIAGLKNANTKGKLVPYDDENEVFNFDLSDENYGGNYDYCTVPAKPNPLEETSLLDDNGAGFKNWLYVFEHENPETADGLYVICKIGGKYYYKVALIDDTTGQPYDIIRNHRYVIYVNDLEEGVSTYELALKADPVNFEVVEMKDVTLTLTPKASTLYYNSTSEGAVTVTVGGIDSAVETLTFTAPGFTILSDYATDEGNGVFRITDRTMEAINFTLTLTDPNQTNAGTVSVTAAGKYVNGGSSDAAETTITLTERLASSGETIMWQGAVEMHNNTADGTTHAGKVLIPYSFFFDGDDTQKIPVNSKISLEYDKNETGYIQTYLFKDGEPSIWDISNGTELTLTQELLTKIKDNHKEVWDIDAAFVFEGGGGAVLKKVTLIPAKESIYAEADKSQLYYDSNDAQVVTVNVTVPDGVETLNISAEDFSFGEDSDGEYTYAVNSQTSATLSFTLKSGLSARTSTITFSDASGNATQASVNVNLIVTPTVTFTNTGNVTLYWNNGSPTNFQVQMTGNNVPNDKTITLTITAPDFTVTAQNGTALTQNGNVWTYTGTLTTLTFTPTSSGDDKPINITGEGENVNVNPASISVDVDATLLAVTSTATINMDNRETSTTLTLTKPGNITNLKVTASNNNAFTINGNEINGDYYIGGLSSNNETIDYTIALRDGFNTAGEYTITFTDNGGGGQSVTATITVKNTPSLQFEYEDNTTLYLDGGDGSPTTLPVTITVPYGSSLTELNITATGFTVTASSEGLSGSEGSYTYTGGSTTFTFVPTAVGIGKTITFTGSGTNLKDIDEMIIVNVVATKPVGGTETPLWTGSWGNWNNSNVDIAEKVSDISDYYVEGNKIKVYFTTGNGNAKFAFRTGYYNLIGTEYTYTEATETSCTLDLDQPTLSKINSEGGLVQIVATNVTITKISVIPASTTN